MSQGRVVLLPPVPVPLPEVPVPAPEAPVPCVEELPEPLIVPEVLPLRLRWFLPFLPFFVLPVPVVSSVAVPDFVVSVVPV